MRSNRRRIQFCLLGALLLQELTGGGQTVTKISTQSSHSLFLKSDGSLWGMGANAYGELGDGTSDSIYPFGTNRPEQIVAGNVTAIAAGGAHTLFLKSNGSLWAMGYNIFGQLGDGTYFSTNRPKRIVASNVVAIAAGAFHSLFLKSDGSLWAMGHNGNGQLGVGTYTPGPPFGHYGISRPRQIVGSNVTAIAAGWYHSLFIKSDGSLWVTGDNSYGQLGDDGNGVGTSRPKQVVANGVTAIAAGEHFSLFLKADGSLWGMGDNYYGQLGESDNNSTNRPTQTMASGITAIAAGADHSLFIKNNGSLWGMGDNSYGRLGDGTNTMTFPYRNNPPRQIVASGVTVIAAGHMHSLFCQTDGTLWGMGDDTLGQLGDGNIGFGAEADRPELIVATSFAIISPLPGQWVTNANWQAIVSGISGTDNQATNVLYNLNGTGWFPASTSNNWTNWTATVTVGADTNIVAVYAQYATGGTSQTKSVAFMFVPGDRLLVTATGQGTIFPNYSNAVLELGRVFNTTATPAAGHKFLNWNVSTNWVGGTVQTNRVLNFIMESNLTLQVNFLDIVRPTNTITSPVSGQRWSNAVFTVEGKAGDNDQVATVKYKLNGGDWLDATTTNAWKNWTVAITPSPRTNVLKAYAVDEAGNRSPTNSVSFIYVVPSPLTLITNGLGGITRSFSGLILEVGRTYSVTAIPGPAQVFSNWVGDVTSSVAALTFVMPSNMTLQANFIPNPFLGAKGIYKGLFGQTNRAQQLSGFVTLALADHGAYSASLKRGTNSYPWTGQFDVAGTASKTVTVGTNPSLVCLRLDFEDHLTGNVSNVLGVADMLANRAVFQASNNPAAQYKGKYTIIIPGNPDANAGPFGDSYGTVTVDAGGNIALAGFLSDGNALSQNVALSGDGVWALYAPLYGGKGSVWSWLTFDTNHPLAQIQGNASWIKPAFAGAKYYPTGFTNQTTAQGSRYVPPTNSTTRVFNLTNGIVYFEGGNLSEPFTNVVTLTATNRVLNGSSNALTLSLTVSNGTFAGKMTVPGTTRTNTFKGALLQDSDAGYGFFLSTNQSGRVFFGPE